MGRSSTWLRLFAADVLAMLTLFFPWKARHGGRQFSNDPRVLAFAGAALLVGAFVASYLIVATDGDEGHFNRWGLYTLLTTLLVKVAIVFLAVLTSPKPVRTDTEATPIALDQPEPSGPSQQRRTVSGSGIPLTGLLTALALTELQRHLSTPAAVRYLAPIAVGLVALVCLLAFLRALYRVLDGRRLRRFVTVTVTGLALWSTAWVIPPIPLFRAHADTGYPKLNVEETYLRQPALVEEALASLLPSTPGVVDTFFVGFAPFAAQNVFENEVDHVERLFRERFDAEGRTALLVNSFGTVDRLPIANAHNLAAVLDGVVAKMGPEDLLFLHVTSHGSEDHDLAVEFGPLGLNDISAAELGAMVAEADPPWRIVVVSACFSGGFIEPLKSANAMVMTAARHDRQSFGCEHGRDYTYFGEALYRDNLIDHDFAGAFQRAVQVVTEMETSEGLTPSEPQIWIGDGFENMPAGREHGAGSAGLLHGSKVAATDDLQPVHLKNGDPEYSP